MHMSHRSSTKRTRQLKRIRRRAATTNQFLKPVIIQYKINSLLRLFKIDSRPLNLNLTSLAQKTKLDFNRNLTLKVSAKDYLTFYVPDQTAQDYVMMRIKGK